MDEDMSNNSIRLYYKRVVDNEETAYVLRQERIKANVSQEEVAERASIDVYIVKLLEAGDLEWLEEYVEVYRELLG